MAIHQMDIHQYECPGALRVRGRISILDVLTVVVLALALGIAVQPGSPLYARATQWMAERRSRQALDRDWATLVSTATPLYVGPGEPQVIEFSDYECPFCRSSHAAVDSAVHAGVRVAMIHVPLPIHPRARPAALAALCASRLGHFREEHEFLMTTTAWQSDTAAVLSPPGSGGVWSSGLAACAADPGTAALLNRHLELARRVGITATPTFVSRHELLRGASTRGSLARFATGQ